MTFKDLKIFQNVNTKIIHTSYYLILNKIVFRF